MIKGRKGNVINLCNSFHASILAVNDASISCIISRVPEGIYAWNFKRNTPNDDDVLRAFHQVMEFKSACSKFKEDAYVAIPLNDTILIAAITSLGFIPVRESGDDIFYELRYGGGTPSKDPPEWYKMYNQ